MYTQQATIMKSFYKIMKTCSLKLIFVFNKILRYFTEYIEFLLFRLASLWDASSDDSLAFFQGIEAIH